MLLPGKAKGSLQMFLLLSEMCFASLQTDLCIPSSAYLSPLSRKYIYWKSIWSLELKQASFFGLVCIQLPLRSVA